MKQQYKFVGYTLLWEPGRLFKKRDKVELLILCGWLVLCLEMTILQVFSFSSDLTGLAFQWIVAALLQLDQGKGYRAASKLAAALKETWAKGDVDPWEVAGNIFDTSWKQVRHEYAGAGEQIVNDTEWRAAIDTEEYS
jgi:hypothetical protein